MSRFFLQNVLIKLYIFQFSVNIFIRNKKLKFCLGDRVAVLNVRFMEWMEYI
jgi:hypothetical protein